MATRSPFVTGEWYHCYNRGTDKRRVFGASKDYERFLACLYVSNGNKRAPISDRYRSDLYSLLKDEKIDRGVPLVEIGVYTLMPTHLHLIIRQLQEEGIARFMQKVFTAYTMYFNLKHQRTGALFSGTFKSKHISDDRYLKQVVGYALLNSVELFEAQWKKGIGNIKVIERRLLAYPYSSAPEFFGLERIEKKIVGDSLRQYYDSAPTLRQLLKDAQEYYQEQSPEV